MKELLNVVSKRIFIYSFLFSLIVAIADYSETFALLYFGTSPLTMDKIVKLTIAIIIIKIVMLLSVKIDSYFAVMNNSKVECAIQKYYFEKLSSMSMKQITNIHTGYIHKLISNVCNYFYDFIWYFQGSVIPLLIAGPAIIYMVCKQSIITGIICILISILAVYLKYKMVKNQKPFQEKANEADSKYNATIIDFIQNIIAVRKLNIGDFCNKKIEKQGKECLKVGKVNEKKRAYTNATFTFLMNMLYIIVLISTILLVKNGQDGLPYLLFYMSALGKLQYDLNSLVRLLDAKEKFKTTKIQLDKYFEECKTIKLIKDFDNIELSNVVFSYNLDSAKIMIKKFILNKGDKISIVGKSGEGKTTVMNILSGLYPLEEGNLLINGKGEKDSRLDLVFVSQEVELFDLTVRDNLCLGKEVSDSNILKLLDEASLMGWYNELPDGLDTIVGEKGIRLSAGQKQRLNIIRGILIDKDLYFFDEPTSNLDIDSEEKIINMINKYLKNKTYVIVTHREKLKQLCNKHYIFEQHEMRVDINAEKYYKTTI